jgi:hypothetical protein
LAAVRARPGPPHTPAHARPCPPAWRRRSRSAAAGSAPCRRTIDARAGEGAEPVGVRSGPRRQDPSLHEQHRHLIALLRESRRHLPIASRVVRLEGVHGFDEQIRGHATSSPRREGYTIDGPMPPRLLTSSGGGTNLGTAEATRRGGQP